MTITCTVRLAAIVYQAGFQIDEFLSRAADLLRGDNVKLGGALQENVRVTGRGCSTMTLVDLASQCRFRISQDLGSQTEGCRLDARGLSEIGAMLDRARIDNVEILVLNKFGKAEKEGGGLRSVFARAVETGIPVITAVRSPYAEAWSEFHGRLAIDLAPDLDAVLGWCRNSVRELREARLAEFSPTG